MLNDKGSQVPSPLSGLSAAQREALPPAAKFTVMTENAAHHQRNDALELLHAIRCSLKKGKMGFQEISSTEVQIQDPITGITDKQILPDGYVIWIAKPKFFNVGNTQLIESESLCGALKSVFSAAGVDTEYGFKALPGGVFVAAEAVNQLQVKLKEARQHRLSEDYCGKEDFVSLLDERITELLKQGCVYTPEASAAAGRSLR